MLEFDQLQHAYNGTPSVNGVSFYVERGEVVSLLGPSGCGKTTLLRLAAGLEKPLAGCIRLDGACYQTIRSRSHRNNAALAICFRITRYFHI